MAIHEGSCHCGRIAFTLDGDVEAAVECNCSICRRRGGLLTAFPREALRLKTPESHLGTYRFNTGRIVHRFCATCGIEPFAESDNPETGARTVMVNVRCLPDVDLAALKIIPFDGASY